MVNAKVLIIDDDPFFLDMLVSILEKKGCIVTKALTLKDGVSSLEKNKSDIIFLDASLKNIKGTSGINMLRSVEKNIDIVVIASLDDASLVSDFLKEGAIDFVLKPFQSEELERVVDRLLKRKDIEKDRELLLFENIEFVELLSLYRRIVKLLTIWEIDRLKDLLLNEIMDCTFGQGALFYASNTEDDDFFICELYKGIVDPELAKQRIAKEFLENPDISYYIKPKELNIPLRLDEKCYGLIKVTGPLLREGFGEKEFNKAYLVCEFVSYAIENAKRLEMLQKCAVKDDKTQAYYWDIFKDFVKKEVYKSLRYDRKLSIIGVCVENITQLKKEYSEDIIKNALVELSNTINSVIRDSDWFVEKTEGELLLFLTETDYFGAIMTMRRIRQALVGRCIIKGSRKVDELFINMVAVGLPVHGISLEELLNVLSERRNLSKNSIYYEVEFNKNNFHALCDAIFSMAYGGLRKDTGLYSWRTDNSNYFFEILELLAKEIKINPKRRGAFYAGFFDAKNLEFIDKKHSFSDVATKIYFFFNANKELFDIPGIVSVGAKENNSLNFLLYLNEQYAYVCVQRAEKYFESCDIVLVEGLINKLQAEYYLQWQL